MLRPLFSAICAVLLLSGCSQFGTQQIALPLQTGWYDSKAVHYITTDVSDRDMARMMQANFAPRLRDAIPQYPKPPEQKTILERVYGFPNGEQAGNVFASIPEPLGYASTDNSYSPIWIMFKVEWLEPGSAQELRSEESILDAEDQGLVKVTRTDVVVNCPIVSIDGKTFLPTP